MRHLLSLALLAALGMSIPICTLAQDDAKKSGQAEAAKTSAEELNAIQQDFAKKQQDFSKAYQAAKSKEDKEKVLSEPPDPTRFIERAVKLAEANPDSPAAVDALFWSLRIGMGLPETKKAEELLVQGFIAKAPLSEVASKVQGYPLSGVRKLYDAILARVEAKIDDPAAPKLLTWINSNSMYGPPSKATEKATKLLMEKFINDNALAAVCQNLANGRGDIESSVNQLRTVLEKSSNKKVLAGANFGLAMLLKEKDASTQKEAETLFEKVVNEYSSENKAIADQAKSELREIRLLGIGKTVPEIAGNDLQDKEFKISDYRGKVVLLDFWGFW